MKMCKIIYSYFEEEEKKLRLESPGKINAE